MNVRLAVDADAEALGRLAGDVQQLHADAHPEFFKPAVDLSAFAADFRERFLSDPDCRVFIVEVDGEAAGYAALRFMRRPENLYTYAINTLYIDQIAVRPSYQGRGCGQALIEAAFDLARAENVNRVALDTWDFNTKAQEFFKKMGFSVFNYRMDVYL